MRKTDIKNIRLLKFYLILYCGVFLIYSASCNRKFGSDQSIIITGSGPDTEFKLPYSVQDQLESERLFKELKVELIYKLDEDLFMPTTIKLYNSSIFVLDQADGYIKRINVIEGLKDTTFIKLGPGKGFGPGETSLPIDFDIDKNGSLYILDLGRRALLKWTREGLPDKDVFFQNTFPFEISVMAPNSVIGTPGISFSPHEKSSLFMQISTNKDQIGYIGEFLSELSSGYTNASDNPSVGIQSAFIGKTLFTEKYIVFIPVYMSQIMIFDYDGNPISIISTIEPKNLPVLNRKSHGGLSFDSKTNRINLGVFECIPDTICVLTPNSHTNFPGSIVIDVYENQTGHYKFSFYVDKIGRFADLDMNLDYLTTINADMEVSIWQIISN